MATSSSSKGPQVFINFRGKDLRRTFLASLEVALRRANINVFVDDNLDLGANLRDLLVKIEQSKVALAIFSQEYTTSKDCLDELVKIKECMDKETLIGVPIFYKLEPSVVSNLEGAFGDEFRKLKRNNQHDLLRSQKWEEALTCIPDWKGMHLKEQSEQTDNQFIESIIQRIKRLLDNISMKENGKRQQNNSRYSMIYARKIEIEHSKNPENWTWSPINEPNEVAIEMATMKELYWMDIRGNFYTRKLTPETKYEVVFVVKLEETATGWHVPVKLNLTLIMSDKSEIVQEQTLCLDEYMDDDEWVDIKAGDFVAPKDAARISFIMSQYDDTVKKTGLVVKGVAIRAVN